MAGRRVRRLALWLSALLVILWTNPATNADSTVCDDLSIIRILMTHKESGQSHIVDVPRWFIPPDNTARDERPPFGEADTVWHSHPGLPDSIKISLPPASAPYDWWRITIFGVDFAGNQSDSSNTISVTAPLPGEAE